MDLNQYNYTNINLLYQYQSGLLLNISISLQKILIYIINPYFFLW